MSEAEAKAPAGPAPVAHPESPKGVAARLGATLLFAGLWLAVALLAWWLAWPGPTPEVNLDAPQTGLILAPGQPVSLSGSTRHARSLQCNGKTATLDGGRFALDLPAPDRPGMYLIRCRATNKRNRSYPFVWGRLAGPSALLQAPIKDAVVAHLDLKRALEPGGVLAPFGTLASKEISAALIKAAAGLIIKTRAIVLGPLSVSGASLVGIEAAGPHRLKLRVALHDVALMVAIPESLLPDAAPEWLKGIATGLAGKRRIALGKRLPVSVTFEWAPGKEPRLLVGPLGSDQLGRVLKRYGPLAQAAIAVLGRFLPSLAGRMSKGLASSQGLLKKLVGAFSLLKKRLADMGGLFPALPRSMSPHQVAACLHIELASLQTDRQNNRLRAHLDARVTSYTTGGKRCAESKRHYKLPKGIRRLVYGPPTPPPPPPPKAKAAAGTSRPASIASPPKARPAILLWVSHDLINAWLTAAWAAGAFKRVPVRLPEAQDVGFDIRSLTYGLPPVVSTDPAGRLRVELPELGVTMHTVDEPVRLLTAQLRIPLTVSLPGPGRLSFTAQRRAPPKIWVRCDVQGGTAGACARQSRRFQQLADVATELAFRPELAGPRLAVGAALPALGAGPLKVDVTAVTPVPRGLKIAINLR